MDELAELLDADRRKWHKQLTKLIDDGFVKRSGKGNRYSPYRHLRAADAAVPRRRPDHEDGGDGSTTHHRRPAVLVRDGGDDGCHVAHVQPSQRGAAAA
jgi:hypothetical protein